MIDLIKYEAQGNNNNLSSSCLLYSIAYYRLIYLHFVQANAKAKFDKTIDQLEVILHPFNEILNPFVDISMIGMLF